MGIIQDYAIQIHELVEKPRNELRRKVYAEHKMEYSELLEKFEKIHLEECQKIENMLRKEDEKIRRKKNRKKN